MGFVTGTCLAAQPAMSGRMVRACAVMLAAALGTVSPAWASLRVADDALARSSAAAVQGRVVATSAAWDADADTIYTFVTLDVAASWGLDTAPARVVVKQLGGVVGTTAFVVGGQARFTVGEDVFVFLEVRPRDHTLSVAGLEQGKWVLDGAPDVASTATREIRGTDPDVAVARDYRSATSLQALAALAGTRVRAAEAVLEPTVPPAASTPGHDGPLYTLLGSTPARWHEADSGTPVFVDSQAGGHPQFPGGGLTQLSNAAAIWSAAGSLRLANGVARTARCFSNSENDGRLSVSYGDPCGEIADTSSTLAIGGAYWSSYDQRVINGVSYWKIMKGMVVVDNTASKFASFTTGCYEEMLVHELGHAIGFGHAAARPAIMYPSISSSCFSRTVSAPLAADDLAGMAALYPGAGVPALTPPGTPTGLTSSVAGGTVNIAWTPSPSGGTATGYQLIAGTAPGASNIGVVPLSSPGVTVPNVPNGTYFVRVVATNAAGASTPTSDVAITVGASAPGAPRNLTGAAGAGGSVSLSWLPPSSGPTPTSYVVLAGYTPGASTFQIPVSGTGLAGSGVGAGVYYVRVVALNGATPGGASNEFTLVVP